MSEPPLNPDWSDKGRQIAALFTPYGDREYQGDLLYRTRLHGEDGISFFFDEGYTYIPWNGLAFLLDAMIKDGDYPNPVVEEQPDPIGDYNIPDEVDEMGGPHRQMTIGEADFDYVLDSVAYEAGETVVEPVKPPAIVQMENDTPAAGDEPASVPDENPPMLLWRPPKRLSPQIQRSILHRRPSKETRRRTRISAAFKSCSRRLCPVNMSICGWRPEKPTILWSFTINTVPITAWSITICRTATGCMTPIWISKSTKRPEHFGLSAMRTAALVSITRLIPTTPHMKKKSMDSTNSFATWLNNIRSQGYEPVRASMMVNDEEVDVDLRPAAEAVPVVEEEQPEQLSLLSLERVRKICLLSVSCRKVPLPQGKRNKSTSLPRPTPPDRNLLLS